MGKKIFKPALTCHRCKTTLLHNIEITVSADTTQSDEGTELSALNFDNIITCRKCELKTKVSGKIPVILIV